MQHAELVVVMQQLKRQQDLLHFTAMRADQICIDLVRALSASKVTAEYHAMDFPSPEAELSASIS
jgi:hypothetical protein